MINWYPGHMAKATKSICEKVKLADLIIEVVDSRAINSTSNKELLAFNKPILRVCLKQDLADTTKVKLPENYLLGSLTNKAFYNLFLDKVNFMLKAKKEKMQKQGVKNPTFYLLVVGLPNVGKSSLINFIARKKILIARNEPAVTRSISVVKINDYLYMQDNPGVLFKKIESDDTGYILSLVNCIKKDVIPWKEVVEYGFNYLIKNKNKELVQYYKLEKNDIGFEDFLNHVAIKKCYKSINNQIDYDRTYLSLFNDFSNSKICKVNYEI